MSGSSSFFTGTLHLLSMKAVTFLQRFQELTFSPKISNDSKRRRKCHRRQNSRLKRSSKHYVWDFTRKQKHFTRIQKDFTRMRRITFKLDSYRNSGTSRFHRRAPFRNAGFQPALIIVTRVALTDYILRKVYIPTHLLCWGD